MGGISAGQIRASLDALAQRDEAIGTALAEARAAYAALVRSLAGGEGQTTLPITKVIDEAAAAQLLGPTGLALNLNLEEQIAPPKKA